MMYHVMPLLAAAATATLAQDRLLTGNPAPAVPVVAEPVAECDDKLLRNEANDELKCAGMSKKGFSEFNDWTPAQFSKGGKWVWAGFNSYFTEDAVITSAGDRVDCHEVCERTVCDLEVDWDGLKAVVKEELHVDLNYDGQFAENQAALMELVNALGGANMNAMPKLQKWVKLNWGATAFYVLGRDPTWWEQELGLGSTVLNSKPTQQQKKGLLKIVDAAIKEIEKKSQGQKLLSKDGALTSSIIISLKGMKAGIENDIITWGGFLKAVQSALNLGKGLIEKFAMKQFCH